MNEATLGRAGRGKRAIDIDMRTAMYRQDIRAWFASWLPKAVRA